MLILFTKLLKPQARAKVEFFVRKNPLFPHRYRPRKKKREERERKKTLNCKLTNIIHLLCITSRNKISLPVYISTDPTTRPRIDKRESHDGSAGRRFKETTFRLIPLHRRRNLLNLRWEMRGSYHRHAAQFSISKEKKKKPDLPRNLS